VTVLRLHFLVRAEEEQELVISINKYLVRDNEQARVEARS